MDAAWREAALAFGFAEREALPPSVEDAAGDHPGR
jgi:hypothetical protein